MIATACLAGNPCPLSHRDPRPTLSQTLRQHGANVIADVAAAERGRTARAEVKERNPVKSDLEVNVSSKSEKPKGRSRETVAKEKNIPERKLRTSLEIDKKAGATSAMTFAPCWRSV